MKKTFTLLFTLLIGAQLWAANIGAWTSSQCNVTLSDNGVLTISKISSQGQMGNYTATKESEWYAYHEQITSAVIEDGVSQIGARVFLNCSNMTSVTIANTVVSIGNHAFDGCSSLTTLTIPESVKIIGTGAFKGCESLQSISCKIITPVELDGDAFKNVSRSIPLYVPWQSVDEYNAAAIWQDFNVLPDPTQCPAWGNCGDQGNNLTWSLDCEGLLTISGTGAMASYSTDSHAPWNFQAKDVKTIVVEEGVKTIGGYAFYNCKNATSITLPNSLLSIGRNAFSICQNITSIVIPSSVANIGQYAFSSCIHLASVRLLGNTSIDNGAFKDCSALTSVLCGSQIPPTCATNAFMNLSDEKLATILLSVPGKAVSDYQAHAVWSKFNIQASDKKKIQFVDEAGQVLKTAMLDEGTMPNADELTPTKADDEDYTYEFAGWLPTLHEVEEDYVYVTQFVRTPKKFFHVTIGGENCSLEVLNKVPEGTFLEVKVNPNECIQFQKWSDDNTDNPRIIEVTGDLNVSAELNKITYTVTDNSHNGHLNIAPQQ